MTTYSIRCKHHACRHRRVARIHPEDYKVVPRCPRCGERKGWRIESRAFRRHQKRCWCSGPEMAFGRHFPHRPTHPLCDQHPHGFYNQARARGVAHEDIPEEYRPMSEQEWVPVSERRPTDHTKKYLVMSNWGIRLARLHEPQWANGEFQDAESDSDEGMHDWDATKGPFSVTHWRDLPAPPQV